MSFLLSIPTARRANDAATLHIIVSAGSSEYRSERRNPIQDA